MNFSPFLIQYFLSFYNFIFKQIASFSLCLFFFYYLANFFHFGQPQEHWGVVPGVDSPLFQKRMKEGLGGVSFETPKIGVGGDLFPCILFDLLLFLFTFLVVALSCLACGAWYVFFADRLGS